MSNDHHTGGNRACDTCEGSGWKRIAVDGVDRVTRCECVITALHAGPPTAEGVPEYFASARLENYHESPHNRHALAAARDFLEGRRRDLYFRGDVGRGKTRIACSILNECSARGERAFFARVPMFLMLQRLGMRGHDENAREADDLFRLLLQADPVCLDDVAGGEKDSDFSRRTLLTLIDHRLDRGLRTIWTSNLGLGELSDFYRDDRLASRIAGAVRETIEIKGDDFRLQSTRRY